MPSVKKRSTRNKATIRRPSSGRKTYNRKSSSGKKVRARLFTLKKDVLKKYGYVDVKHKSAQARHAAIDRALADGVGPLSLFRKINALYVLNENRDPRLAAMFHADREYVKTTPGYKHRASH